MRMTLGGDECVWSQAERFAAPRICEPLAPEARAECYFRVSGEARDPDLCARSGDPVQCRVHYAHELIERLDDPSPGAFEAQVVEAVGQPPDHAWPDLYDRALRNGRDWPEDVCAPALHPAICEAAR